MDRIQHSSATSTHQFTEGDPGNGIPATTVTATHMNGVQNELVHIIEEAGITPQIMDVANFDVVREARRGTRRTNRVEAWVEGRF